MSNLSDKALKRLEAIEEQFAEVMNDFASRGPLPEHHRAKIDEFEKQRDTIRTKLAGADLREVEATA